MARPGPTNRGQLHVGRYLGALLGLFALLYAGVVFGGTNGKPLEPKLGLDLQGGAQVILTPKTANGSKASAAQLSTAVDILRQRVNGAGVSEAEVVVEGSQVVVSVPGGNRASIQNVTKTAQLQFRRVVESQIAVPTATASPTTSGTPKPTTSPKAGTSVVTPKPTSTTNKRPVSRALLGAAASPTPTPSATPTPKATDAAQAPAVRSGDVYSAQNYALLDCSDPKARAGGAPDVPAKEIVACDKDGVYKYHLAIAKVVGKDIKGANVGNDPTTGAVQVNLQFKGSGQDKWTNLTKEAYNQTPPTNQVAIVLDGVIVSAPTIQSVINSDAQITGQFSQKEGNDLANELKYGALPLSFEAGDATVVSATLGDDQLTSGLLAGGIGLAAVVLYCLLYYRALGFVTIASLLVSGGLIYGSICVLGSEFGFALSLAGIAGLIVSVGITADSFVVYFERLKDEIKEGRTPRSAVDRAWVRARRTILSADTVSILAALILYFVSVGGVRGFAFTLGLSTLLDVAVVFLFTRPLISWLSRFGWFSRSRLTGFYGPDGGEPSTGAVRKSLIPKDPTTSAAVTREA
ncbi:MAG: protein-export rane protein SecD [Frankiales bacterium]|nr:protein-export rane protein SecD [Frankiales bacterium]